MQILSWGHNVLKTFNSGGMRHWAIILMAGLNWYLILFNMCVYDYVRNSKYSGKGLCLIHRCKSFYRAFTRDDRLIVLDLCMFVSNSNNYHFSCVLHQPYLGRLSKINKAITDKICTELLHCLNCSRQKIKYFGIRFSLGVIKELLTISTRDPGKASRGRKRILQVTWRPVAEKFEFPTSDWPIGLEIRDAFIALFVHITSVCSGLRDFGYTAAHTL